MHETSSFQQSYNCLKVTGNGNLSLAPDQAEITVGAITEDESLQIAQQENSSIIANVIAALQLQGIPREDIQTVVYRIDSIYDYKEGVQIFRGYKVNHQLQVSVKQIELTGQIVDIAVNQGANSVSNIQFTLANQDAYYNEALKKALNNAYRKAVSLTSQLHVRIHPIPYKIEELSQGTSPPVPYAKTMLAAAEATPIQPGEITITASLIVFYLYC